MAASTPSRPTAHIKRYPEDWRVDEHLAFDWAGEGEHLYVFVEKRGLNTIDVAADLAQHYNVSRSAVGFAGRKDKHAVTRQWFSVPTPGGASFSLPGVTLLDEQRHTHKLRLGQHDANHFQLILRDVGGQPEHSFEHPFPNMFGPQRVSDANLDKAFDWLGRHRQRRIGRNTRGWYLSVLRSFFFNQVVLHRQRLGLLFHTVDGDVLQDGVPTAPLWGRGRSQSSLRALDIETEALRDYATEIEALEHTGVNQARRVMNTKVTQLQKSCHGQELELSFCLPPGSFATAWLNHLFEIKDDSHA